MKKIVTIVGTRPEIIKLCLVIRELENYSDHVLVHTGQNYDYELNEIFFKDLKINPPDHFLNVSGKNPAETVGNIISRSYEILEREKPDAVLIYGDTNSCLSSYSAKRLKIPVFHMEAGNRCFDERVPEEINRRIIDHISDINLTISELARNYLISEGIGPETIIKVGSSMKEILNLHTRQIESSNILAENQLKSGEYIIASLHREENIDDESNFKLILDTIRELPKTFSKKLLVSTHPRTRKKLESINYSEGDSDIVFSKPYGFFDYLKLQKEAFCVISDSGTITEESSILGFPAITIRQSHERPEGMDEGTLIMSGLESGNVIQAIRIVTGQMAGGFIPETVLDYKVPQVSKKVVRIIHSYIEYVNRNTWKK